MYSRISDPEFEQSIIRLLLGLIVMLYLLACTPYQTWMLPAFTGFILISLGLSYYIKSTPGDYWWRKISGQLIDLGAISINLYFCGESGVVIIGVYLWVIVGNGCRFGVQYLLSAIVISTIFFSLVAFNEPFWIQHKSVALGVGITQLIVPVYFAVLLRRLDDAKNKLEILSFYDELTGVMNRRAFDDRLAIEYSRLKRFPSSFSLAFVDIDHFKKVNDTYGHLYGDIVLQKIAGIIKDTSRDVDIVARYGGEEFVLLIPGHINNEKGSVGERLRSVIENTEISLGQKTIKVTISVGMATWEEKYNSSKDWIQAADEALYQAKQKGRNQVISR